MRIDRHKFDLALARSGLTQSEVARIMGLRRQTLGTLIKGGRDSLPRSVGRLAAALGVDPADIIEEEA